MRIFAACAIGSCISFAAAQTTIYVNGDCGNDTWTGLSSRCQSPDGPKSKIEAGIDASSSGDTVLVADGVYTGDLNFDGKLITVRSLNGPEMCVIDGGQVTCDANCDGTIDAFDIEPFLTCLFGP